MAEIVHEPAVAGGFYPGDPAALVAAVDTVLRAARPEIRAPKAVIAPHAGYVYSGAVAATAYAGLAARRAEIRRVVLFGPAHRLAFKGVALPRADAFATPLGRIPLDWSAMAGLLNLPGVVVDHRPFAREHSLEVQLPFLQRILGPFALVPVLVGGAEPALVQDIMRRLWGGPETAIVVSSDLSHYHDHATATAYDRDASRAIEALTPDAIKDHQACGRIAIKALLGEARRLDLRATTVDLRNSGDTAGPKDRVVGYGSYAFEYAATARLSESRRRALLDLAERAIRFGIAQGKAPEIRLADDLPASMTALRGTFVTLELDGRLRGCIGSLAPHRPLAEDVAVNAWKAAFGDPRFPGLTREELARCHLSVSVLSTSRPLAFADEAELAARLNPDRDGVILADGNKRGLFLPHVWSSLPDPRRFVRALKQKAGLAPDHWSPTMRAWRFGAEAFGRAVGAA